MSNSLARVNRPPFKQPMRILTGVPSTLASMKELADALLIDIHMTRQHAHIQLLLFTLTILKEIFIGTLKVTTSPWGT